MPESLQISPRSRRRVNRIQKGEIGFMPKSAARLLEEATNAATI
jgi:hypothetical protein